MPLIFIVFFRRLQLIIARFADMPAFAADTPFRQILILMMPRFAAITIAAARPGFRYTLPRVIFAFSHGYAFRQHFAIAFDYY